MRHPIRSLAVWSCGLGLCGVCLGAGLPAFDCTPEWEAKIAELAPEEPVAAAARPRRVLSFSLTTGFKHWCIPHTDAVVEILGRESGAYETVRSTDIEQFRAENLARYDAVVLNNNCPDGKDRDVFRDVLVNKMDTYGDRYRDLPPSDREALAKDLYGDLMAFVADGGGLVLLHGAIANFNYSDEFSAAVGGSFHFHPPQQEVVLLPAAPPHPLLKPFDDQAFVHVDEPYVFNRAYPDLNFRPLLQLDTGQLEPHNRLEEIRGLPRYVSWIKPYKQGRVFFCSPSHNAQSFERPELLQFILGGMQYALGDLDCPDSPLPLAP